MYGRNPASGAGLSSAEQARYESGYERAFGKKRRTRRAHARRAAGTTQRRAVAAPKRKRRKSAAKAGHHPAQRRALRREHAYKAAIKKGLSQEKAAKKAMRAVPFLKSEKKGGRTYKGIKATARRGKRKPWPKQTRTVKMKRRRKVVRRVSVKGKQRVAYRDSKGRLRKIPAHVIASAGVRGKGRAERVASNRGRITRARERAAARVLRGGGVFVPNRSKAMKVRRSRKHRRAKSAHTSSPVRRRRRRSAVTAAPRRRRRRAAALTANRPRRRRARKTAAPRRRRRRSSAKRYTANKSSKRAAAARKGWRRRKASGSASPRRRRRAGKRRYRANRGFTAATARKASRKRWRKTGVKRGRGFHGRKLARGKVYYRGKKKPRVLRGRRARRLPKARIYLTNKRRHRRSHGTHRRRYRSNGYRRNGFLGMLGMLVGKALFLFAGFAAQKVLTKLLGDKVILPLLAKQTPSDTITTISKYVPILAGIPVTGLAVAATMRFAPKKYATELAGGFLLSFLHTTVVTVLQAQSNADVAAAAAWLAGYEGYRSPSSAAAIGRGLRGMRGLGSAPQQSIMPRYNAIGPKSNYMQAVAGRGSMGEYFSANGLGEYFASDVQGVGNYEKAGPLVTQAAAGLGQTIDDGVRPDANLDDQFALMEAQAGLGEYYSNRSTKAGRENYVIPQQSQWIPSGMFAETQGAGDPASTSEIPAGILESPGGNGVFG